MRYRRLLCVMELTPWSHAAVDESIGLASALKAELVLLAPLPIAVGLTVDPLLQGAMGAELEREALALEAQQRLQEAGAQAEKAGVLHHPVTQRRADLTQLVLEQAARWHCQCIVVATPPHNAVMRLLTGSLVPSLITASYLPVIVCKAGGR